MQLLSTIGNALLKGMSCFGCIYSPHVFGQKNPAAGFVMVVMYVARYLS